MRIAITGAMGQVATSLIEQAGPEFEIVLLGRRVFLLDCRLSLSLSGPTFVLLDVRR